MKLVVEIKYEAKCYLIWYLFCLSFSGKLSRKSSGMRPDMLSGQIADTVDRSGSAGLFVVCLDGGRDGAIQTPRR